MSQIIEIVGFIIVILTNIITFVITFQKLKFTVENHTEILNEHKNEIKILKDEIIDIQKNCLIKQQCKTA